MAFKTFFNWSTGKDSALALYSLLQDPSYSVDQLFTTISMDSNRVSMHGIQRDLLLKQASQIGLPLSILELPEQTSMQVYDQLMQTTLVEKKKQGFTHAGFGDIFLEDLRTYRESKLESIGLQAHFPLWKIDSLKLMHKFIDLGFKAITVAVNAKVLDKTMVGKEIDEDFLQLLPLGVDPCGENGEFHTFVYDGPIFKKPVEFIIGDKVLRTYSSPNSKEDKDHQRSWDDSFWFCDLSVK
ncbi:diphthine--ammonia ligase [Galbibacter sp.]|jgi:uncharacterized protein (TIGR00290 family)|uniref:Dph6-related ATP pyrophosphatase n=1 Tax=Galbibacter sp. TaxID=2918471 RepID=UPI003A92682B